MKTVAIIGASSDRNKYGNKAVRAFRQQGYEVFPINPKEERIEGLPAFKSISEVPVRPQKISVYVPPSVLLKLALQFSTTALPIPPAATVVGLKLLGVYGNTMHVPVLQ